MTSQSSNHHGVMEVVRVIESAHDSEVVAIAYNAAKREIFSAAEGDKVIKTWDSRNGQLVRALQGHKGMVTSLYYSSTVHLLFSGSIDSTVGIWTEKGANLQMMSIGGGPVHSLGWDERRRYLIVGGHSIINIFRADVAEAKKTSQQQRSVASGLKEGGNASEAPQILKRVYQPLKGPDLCHTDVINCMVITDTGKLVTGGYDRSLCIYEFDKLDKPREAFQRIKKCHTSAILSMAYDASANCILTGSIDGSMKSWSVEGRLLDKFENINDKPVSVAYISSTNMYWGSGKFGRLVAFDPRAPANVTEFIRESNGLDRYHVTHMYSPYATNLLLGSTKNNQLVIWQHNKQGAYRTFHRHQDWVESLVVVRTRIGGHECEEVFTAGADGIVLRWQLDSEQNCDVYQCIEEIDLHEGNIYCIAYSEELECLVSGGEDCSIQLHYLSQQVPTFNDVPLPTFFNEHEERISGLALLKGKLLASVSYDRSIRVWDLTSMKPISVLQEAHDTPIQCIEYCRERDEIATCEMGNKVKIWDARNPAQLRLKLELNHADGDSMEEDEDSVNAKSNMQWLTRSDMAGLPQAHDPMLQEVLKKAGRDVPEVTQVRWVSYRSCWATAADDDMIRLWSPEGVKLHQFTYNGGSVQSLFIDSINQLLVASMLDKNIYIWDLDDPMPQAVFKGHQDVVRGVGYLAETKCFVSCSWDKTIRLWNCPDDGSARSKSVQSLNRVDKADNDSQEDEEQFVSSYEKKHPLETPKALLDANQFRVLKAIVGITDDDKGRGRKGGKGIRGENSHGNDEGPVGMDDQGSESLASKLDQLNRDLLNRIMVKTAPKAADAEPKTGALKKGGLKKP